MARHLITTALALSLMSGGAFAQSYSTQSTTTQNTPAGTTSSTVEKKEGVSGTEMKRSEYQSNTATGASSSSTERHVQGPDGSISSSTRREQTAPIPAPAQTNQTTTTTTTVR